MVKYWTQGAMQMYLLWVSLFAVTAGTETNCRCDYVRREVVCARMDISDFKENNNLCGMYEKIDISGNYIRKFPNDLYQFQSVNIAHNFLKYFDVSVKQKVEYLDVTGNNIIEINFEDWFPNLRHLDASNNNLGFGNENFLQGHCNLVKLDVTSNIIMSLQSVTKCEQLSVLQARRNVLTNLPKNLSLLRKLKTLNLGKNKLMNANGLPTGLVTLELSYNRITKIDVAMFKGLATLTFLNLDGNKIKDIEPGSFSSLVSLETLKLNKNEIKKLTSDTFHGLKSLKVVELFWNNIVYVWEDTFKDLPALETVILAKNQILALPALQLGKNVKFVSLIWNHINRVKLQALSTMFSGSAVPRRVSFPLNKLDSDDPGWVKVVRAFSWECIRERLSYTNGEFRKLPKLNLTNVPVETIDMTDGECVCAFFTDSRGMTFDTCVRDGGQIDGYPWLVAVGMAAERQHFTQTTRDDM